MAKKKTPPEFPADAIGGVQFSYNDRGKAVVSAFGDITAGSPQAIKLANKMSEMARIFRLGNAGGGGPTSSGN